LRFGSAGVQQRFADAVARPPAFQGGVDELFDLGKVSREFAALRDNILKWEAEDEALED
jgi:hypothetical protein